MVASHQHRSGGKRHALTGPEKVGILLLALGKTKAAKLLRRLDPDELRLLTRSSSKLRPVSSDEVEDLIEEFAESFTGGINFAGTAEEVKSLLTDVMSEDEIAQYMSDQPDDSQPVWERLVPLRDNVLQPLILKEHPQTIAVILSRIDSNVGARLLRTLDPEARHSLLRRMLGLKGISAAAMAAIEAGIREDLMATMMAAPNPETRKTIAGIINKLDGSQANEILKSIAATRPDDANELKSMLFSFADIANLKSRARALVIEKVPTEQVVLAMNGADSDLQEAILQTMTARQRRMVEAELEAAPPARARDIDEARRAIVATVLALMGRGEITMEDRITDDSPD
ncbi:FliG C-terminal domain-containing protein [Hyphomicrobium sp. D-2]|uniref:flagellar motor switch protein FliG n=1 Tax=Hyphomicrobium sp. D-2 TaxID=3041621 RepID=UPI0024571CE8|nr:FliG C-terminal domain-containing protein [Hyphomicrobium sp. D-2]MDH4983640.1 FliG C-terminal domain-containing protein [Hyphomicrobium sp. D-2]